MTTSTRSTLAAEATTTHRPGVPWATVVPVAVVIAYADGFWVTSMRGAVGAVGRGQGPFTTWWHQSTVLVPLYVCAVIGALALALRWSRRGGGARAGLLATGGLVVLAATLVAVVVMAAGAAYDYHVQSGELQMMATMRGDCRVDCLERLRQDTMWLQVRATGLGAGLLLLTNLGVVAWFAMLCGGRLDAARRGRPRARVHGAAVRRAPYAVSPLRRLRTTPVAAGAEVRLLLAATLVGGALIHVAVVPEHLDEWPAAGAFFIVLTALQAGAAAVLLRGPRRGVLLLVLAVSAGPVAVWVWSRVWGLPLGPEPGVPEPVGLPDCAAGVLELAAVVLAVVLLRRGAELARRPRLSDHVGRLVVTAVLAVTVIGLAATQEGWFDLVQASDAAGSTMTSR
ncbi:hypothetical protein GCM10009868_38550 [Terrabacter aerolatus]|uniref:Uncharacterized protein n=1 Tax=Terrabacter aerolatus TaxID=422442 RepID=A0A512D0L8_9MICO|nr:hypothetical protein [Terrabacter aerolatus]GEO30012.1 hypothetical protein TAE01_18220 [Terrabacter aerolatus]